VKQVIARHCPQCKQYQELAFTSQSMMSCPGCSHAWGQLKNPDDIFDYCPICDCRQFYLSKGFNQFFGCLIILVAIVLVPVTYGLSLPVFAFVDWILWKRVPTVINCYRCGTEFQNFTTDRRFKPFLHHIGLKYDKYR